MKPIRINIDQPPMGGKAWLLENKGIFVLEECAGDLRTIACTHAGSGSLSVIDGIPDEHGFFPDHEMKSDHSNWEMRNGRPIYRANPVVMGSWMLDAGFFHGLTIIASGGTDSASAIATIVWVPHKPRIITPKPKTIEVPANAKGNN